MFGTLITLHVFTLISMTILLPLGAKERRLSDLKEEKGFFFFFFKTGMITGSFIQDIRSYCL